METARAETSPAPSATGLKGVLAKARRGRGNNPSTSTLSLNGTDSNGTGARSVRSSIDHTVDKIKARVSGEHDDEDRSSPSRIAKLLPGNSKRRRKKKKREAEADEELQHAEDLQRGRSITEQSSTGSADLDGTVDRSRDTLDDDARSSQMTYDSDEEA